MTLSPEVARAVIELSKHVSQEKIANRLGVSVGYVNNALNPLNPVLPANATLQEMLDHAWMVCEKRTAQFKAEEKAMSRSRRSQARSNQTNQTKKSSI